VSSRERMSALYPFSYVFDACKRGKKYYRVRPPSHLSPFACADTRCNTMSIEAWHYSTSPCGLLASRGSSATIPLGKSGRSTPWPLSLRRIVASSTPLPELCSTTVQPMWCLDRRTQTFERLGIPVVPLAQ
jgi:hypothetical protein